MQVHQITYVADGNNHLAGVQLTFHNYKHHYNERPFTLTINRQPTCCPIALLVDYLALRGTRAGALFMSEDGTPVTRETFSKQLSTAVRLCGLEPNRYKGHSFRIGAASHAASRGMSDSQIRVMG